MIKYENLRYQSANLESYFVMHVLFKISVQHIYVGHITNILFI